MLIQLLDQNTINKIAAGEVVERPASVIKELVENAIDANATAITIEVVDGGLKLIRITDNGTGIEKEDVKTAFLRHSTSKIREANDLITIASLGFRGEALASIAAVGMVELITKQANELTGVRYVIEGGYEKSFEEVGCPSGTTFIVRDLFYNTPARLKFMKSSGTELGYISDLVNKLAMGHPEVSFKLVSNHKTKLHTSGNSKLKDAIYSVYGKEITQNLIEIKATNPSFSVEGYIGKPHISRGNKAYENYYLNGRYIKSKVVEKAVEDGYKSKLMLHKYPFVTFHIKMDAKEVDVNVHPTKMEVRFVDEALVYKLIYQGIEAALNRQELIPQVSLEDVKVEKKVFDAPIPEPFELRRKTMESISPKTVVARREAEAVEANKASTVNSMPVGKEVPLVVTRPVEHIEEAVATQVVENKEEESVATRHEENKEEESVVTKGVETREATPTYTPEVKVTPSIPSYKGEQVAMDPTHFIGSGAAKTHKVVGQLFDTYWIVELDQKYYIIDQHAAHEKVLYERMLKTLEEKIEFGQRLLKPVVVNLSMQEMARYEAHTSLFTDLGYEVEAFGEEALIIRSVPFIFDKTLDPDQFLQILDALEDTFKEDKYSILLDDIASMSCKAAVKGNDRLSKAEYIRLIDDLLTLDNPFHCPHGRPTIIAMTQYELEKKFKRIQ